MTRRAWCRLAPVSARYCRMAWVRLPASTSRRTSSLTRSIRESRPRFEGRLLVQSPNILKKSSICSSFLPSYGAFADTPLFADLNPSLGKKQMPAPPQKGYPRWLFVLVAKDLPITVESKEQVVDKSNSRISSRSNLKETKS